MASIQSFEIERMESEIARLTEQRDALLAACEDIARGGCVNRLMHEPCGACDPCAARVAIEKARSK